MCILQANSIYIYIKKNENPSKISTRHVQACPRKCKQIKTVHNEVEKISSVLLHIPASAPPSPVS
jgi:hypothetical protein